MNNKTTEWNIIIENKKFDELNNKIDELQTENTNLKIELNDIKKELKDANSYINNNIIETRNPYLYSKKEDLPFHLQYKNRFNKCHIPTYYTFSNTPISDIIKYDTPPIIALKEHYQPFSNSVYNGINELIPRLY